jgi:hypothetical protein
VTELAPDLDVNGISATTVVTIVAGVLDGLAEPWDR